MVANQRPMRTPLTLAAALCLLGAQAQTTHELTVTDHAFIPAHLPIRLGDHVHIVWSADATEEHSFTQVEQATWDVGGAAPLNGGFNLGADTPNEGTEFTITPTDEVWFVCRYHVDMGMKGLISVEGATGLEESAGPHEVRFAPNPAQNRTVLVAPEKWPIRVRVMDRTAQEVMVRTLFAERSLDVSVLPPGLYLAEVWYMDGPLLGRKRLLVER